MVREARRRASVTQAELAALAGTTQSAIARLEKGKGSPSWESVIRLLRLMGFEPDIRLAPQGHDWSLAEETLRLSFDERVQRLVRAVAFIAAGREAREKTRAGR